ncbi:FkbM family methyltransferase [Caulobacter sp. 73W]|uniref:FkbM family methyltransferase n=1 Tax=Caulobacter sp. 73W TaxID=3161137 RepID=A0AB39KZ19_9CAUL
MRPARLDLSVRNAMGDPQPAPTGPRSAPRSDATPEAAPTSRNPVRRLLGRTLGPVAHYARRYLNASVEHHLKHVDHRITELSEQMERLERSLQASMLTVHRGLDSAHAQRQTALIQHLDARTEGLAGLFGPRFDEIELKTRPLIDYDADTIAVRLGDGYVMAPRDQPLFTLMLADATTGGLEPGTRRALKKLIVPGMNVADVGANVGLLTLVCARSTGHTGLVWAFEPELGPRTLASKMAAANGLSWVDLRDTAVGAKAGTLTFNVSPIIGHSSLYALPGDEQKAAKKVKVKVVTLDEAIGPKTRLDVVKIDVEGAELDVLEGMAGLLKANTDLAIIAEYGPSHLERVGITPTAWFKAFTSKGYKAYAIAEPTGLVSPCDPKSLEDVELVNIAFVKPGGAAAKRLGAA